MAKRAGVLIFDARTESCDIRFGLSEYYGGLHCGECLDVFCGGRWKPTRIEMKWKEQWYLVGVDTEDLNGLRVRI